MSRIAAIHQPNFFPWLGYFDKIARADVFVILDDVQHQKTGSNWSNRVRLLVSGEPRWVTAPVERPPHGTVRVDEARLADGPWRDKLLKAIELNYRRAPAFARVMDIVAPLVTNPEELLAGYNIHAIEAIAGALGLADNRVRASGFAVAGAANERLVALVRAAGCDTYLAGGGAAGYQDDASFEAAGLKLKYQSFAHPVYPQRGAAQFVAGLSILDALMNCGVERTRELILS